MLNRWILLWTVFASIFHLAIGLEKGPNVCTKHETRSVNITVSYNKLYKIRSYTWCSAIPPRCSVYRDVYKLGYKKEARTIIRTVNVCCEGFVLTSNGTSCEPCPFGKYGFQCEQECNCTNKIPCDPVTGACACKPGRQGSNCDKKCDKNFYGIHCEQKCNCENNATCNAISGACECKPGYKGPLCTESCSGEINKISCSNTCNCQNGGRCKDGTKDCICPPGWTGAVCANPCTQGFYGKKCKERCECYNGASCDHLTGECICHIGHCGEQCQYDCSVTSWGLNCSNTDTCSNNTNCDSTNGTYICSDVTGEYNDTQIQDMTRAPAIMLQEALPHDSCLCRKFKCECCLELAISAIGLDSTGCLKAEYLPEDYGISVSFIIDTTTVIAASVSVRNPPPLCYPIPFLKSIVHICLEFNNVSISSAHFGACVRVEIVIWHMCVVAPYSLVCFDTMNHGTSDPNAIQPVKKNHTEPLIELSLHKVSMKFPFAVCSSHRFLPNFYLFAFMYIALSCVFHNFCITCML